MIYGQATIRQNSAQVCNRQAVAEMERGKYISASVHLLLAIVADPEYWPAYYNLGNCRYKLSDLDSAVWAYEQAVRRCDDFAPLLHNLGTVHCRLGEYIKALPYLRHARRLCLEVDFSLAHGYVCMIPAGEDQIEKLTLGTIAAGVRV